MTNKLPEMEGFDAFPKDYVDEAVPPLAETPMWRKVAGVTIPFIGGLLGGWLDPLGMLAVGTVLGALILGAMIEKGTIL